MTQEQGPEGGYEIGKDPDIVAVLSCWRHGDDAFGDWVKMSDLPEGMSYTEIVGHACKTLVEYEAQKRHTLLDGVPLMISGDFDDAAEESFQEALSAYDNKLRGHIDWISTHAVFVLASSSVDPVRLMMSLKQIVKGLPDDGNE